MAFILKDLVIDRVDLVDEGANSAAFVELYKRKEQSVVMELKEIVSKMKPEHADVINKEIAKLNDSIEKLTDGKEKLEEDKEKLEEDKKKATDELEKSNNALTLETEELAKAKASIETLQAVSKSKTDADMEAELIKSMPEEARLYLEKVKTQKEAAEAELKKAKEVEIEATAVAKATELKALPIEKSKLVQILKGCDEPTIDMLTTISAAINSTVLKGIGSDKEGVGVGADAAWEKIEEKAANVMIAESVTKAKAIATVIKTSPNLYEEYLKGGAN